MKFVSAGHANFVRSLRERPGRGIWLIGGGEVNTLLLNEGLIDEIHLFIMPIVIPDGIGIFQNHPNETMFKLEEHTVYSSGVVELLLVKRTGN